MSADRARLKTALTKASCLAGCFGLAALGILFGYGSLRTAAAEGETRTISLHHMHTDENITITYKRNGRYDDEALKKLDWFLRDWRRQESTHMDPKLFDIIWEVTREVHAQKPIEVVCGYRAPATNEMLRKRSSGVAKGSLHTHGQAMDFYIPDVSLKELRYAGLRLQRGGVGFYPTSGSPFVHLDTGNVRHWPSISREELARVFPDGRTVHVPDDGRPLAGYALALQDVEKRGGRPSQSSLDAAGAGSAAATDDDEENAIPPQAVAAADPPAGSATPPMPRARPKQAPAAVAVAATKNSGSARGPWEQGSGLARLDGGAPGADSNAAQNESPDAIRTAGLAYAPASETGVSARTASAPAAESVVPKTFPGRSQPKPVMTGAAVPPGAAIVAASARAQNTDDLWTRAILFAPDLQNYMNATLLGAPDFKQLRELMRKPQSALATSFSDDPLQGATADRFSGDSAVVFLATVHMTKTQSAMLKQ
ncbi:MAG: DUF882 domain-containing protein [Xanthobacteraceae bacterium]|nr:DUF882 domain-containing protein [Xanthobacteraceae bacterium]